MESSIGERDKAMLSDMNITLGFWVEDYIKHPTSHARGVVFGVASAMQCIDYKMPLSCNVTEAMAYLEECNRP